MDGIKNMNVNQQKIMEIDPQLMKQIISMLKTMYNMSQTGEWNEFDAQSLIMDGADLYADYFRNNN